jgi:hypothetical protein
MGSPPGKGYISQLPLAQGIGATDSIVVDQIVNGSPTTRRAFLSALFNLRPNRQTGTAYTLQPADLLLPTWLIMANAGPMVVTIPTQAALNTANAGVAVPQGVNLIIQRYGVGTLTITPAAGVTLRFSSSATAKNQYSFLFLALSDITNEWSLGGDQT